jgi:transcriptional regulator with XRE-family HTH domain
MTVTNLSKKSGVNRKTLNDWLSSDASPRDIAQVKSVANVLGVSIDELVFGSSVDLAEDRITELDALLGDDWIGGLFEVRFRRVKK